MNDIVPTGLLLILALLVTTGLACRNRRPTLTVWCCIGAFSIIFWCLFIWAATFLIGDLIA